MATLSKEILPPPLDATGVQPPLFDGTTRLYTCYTCPFAQRVWTTRNYKGLHEKIMLVPLNLQNSPAWYKDVYPPNKVPSLEHNGKIIGESLELIKYVDSNFEGPSLFPDDPKKKEFGEKLFSYTDKFIKTAFPSSKGDPAKEIGPLFDYFENALHKFDDGPFFLGQLSLVDIVYIPFVERFQIFLSEVFKIDITAGRPKLAAWIEVLNKIDACTQTKTNPKELNEVIGKIIGDSNFEGPSDVPEKKKFAEELFSYTDKFVTTVFPSSKGDLAKEIGPVFDYLENALHKFNDKPFFLGQFSLVDIAYIPFVERFQIFLSKVFEIDITAGRPKLAAWIEELNKIDAYTQTKTDPKELNKDPKKKFAEDLISDLDLFVKNLCSFKGNPAKGTAAVFDYLEGALREFDDGPFFLGQLSLVDIACITYVEKFQIFLPKGCEIDITANRPKLAVWIEELKKIYPYTQTN